jgi:hypothetical protein
MVPQHRALRIVKIVFVAFGLFLFVVLHLMDAHHPAGVLKLTHKMIAALALADVVLGIVFQRYFMKAPIRPEAHGTAATVAQRFFTAHIIRLAFTLSTCLLGVVVHSLGAPRWLGRTLVGVGVLFMMIMKTGKSAEEPVGGIQEPVASSS